MVQRITIIHVRKNTDSNVNDKLQWIGNSLGLFNPRDKNQSCFRIFIVLLKHAKQGQIISSDYIAESLGLSRGTVVHHLDFLRGNGLVIRDKGGYILRENSLEGVLNFIKRDVAATIDSMLDIAREIDSRMG
ncbi:hypothetical protein CL619_01705 [archaeon]|nr:hypothetical protein [archaeon]|tara:strand:- start:284 stop:679 length:396 start_codon:yes stop_codon:yes gene_type:complete